jgi:hypothetical protein
VTIELGPTFVRGLDQLEDHCDRGLVREALRSDREVSHRGEQLSIGFVVHKPQQASIGQRRLTAAGSA